MKLVTEKPIKTQPLPRAGGCKRSAKEVLATNGAGRGARASVAVVAAGLLLAVVGCARALALEKVRLAVPARVIMYAPLYLGIEQGLFAKQGLAIEVVSMRTDLAIAALGSGEVDFIAHGGAALRAAAQGFPLKLIFALDHKAPFWLVAQPKISAIRMLKGARIGISFPGDTPHLIVKRYLRRQGVDPEREVAYVGGQFSPIGMQGLLSRALDAAVLSPPFNVLAVEHGLRSLAFLGDAVPDATTANGLVTSNRKIKLHPERVQAMVRASLESLRLYREKKESVPAFLATEFAISRQVAERVYKESLEIFTPRGEISREKIQNILNLVEETKLQKPLALRPDAILDFSFLRKAQAQLGQ